MKWRSLDLISQIFSLILETIFYEAEIIKLNLSLSSSANMSRKEKNWNDEVDIITLTH
jgi:hypothetical protein